MELHVSAPFDGAVASIRCVVGDMVERHQHLGEVAPIAASAVAVSPTPMPTFCEVERFLPPFCADFFCVMVIMVITTE